MNQITHHQRAQAHLTIERVVRKMRRDDADLAARAQAERPDGYPSGGQGGHSNVAADPTGTVVVKRLNEPDEAGKRRPQHATRAIELTMKAAALLAQADSLRALALPPAVADDPDDTCTNCEKSGELSPRGDEKAVGKHSTLCSWCHAFQREHGVLPPRVLVRKHARGDRIFDRDILQALRRQEAG